MCEVNTWYEESVISFTPWLNSWEMKLKIVHQNQENRGVEEQVTKKESLDMDQMEETLTRPSPDDESTKLNSPSREVSPTADIHPWLLLVGFFGFDFVNLMVVWMD